VTVKGMISETRIKIYQMALEGKSQIQISLILNIKKPTVSGHIKELLSEKFLEEDNTKKQFIQVDTTKRVATKTYRRGANSNILDSIIQKIDSLRVSPLKSTAGSQNPDVTAVPSSKGSKVPKKGSGYQVEVFNVHHVAYIRKIEKQGDSQFFYDPIELKNNVLQYVGHIEATAVSYRKTRDALGYVPRKKERDIIVSLFESVKEVNGAEVRKSKLLIHIPTIYLTENQLDSYKEITRIMATDIYDFLERSHGWKYSSEVMPTNWDVHIAVEEPNLKGLTDKITVHSDDKKLYTSNSDKKSEMEASGSEAVTVMKAYANMPLKAEELEEKIAFVERYQKAQLNYTNESNNMTFQRLEKIENTQEAILKSLEQHQAAFKEFVDLDTIFLNIQSRNRAQDIESIQSFKSDTSEGMYQ